jgi:hypothetical protein
MPNPAAATSTGTNSGRFQMEEPEKEVDLEDVGEPEAESSCESVAALPEYWCAPLLIAHVNRVEIIEIRVQPQTRRPTTSRCRCS